MAPELVRDESAVPNTQTDLHSLAVLLFYMLVLNHPLEGKREANIEILDPSELTKLYGDNPVFIYDPDDTSNRPDPEIHLNALAFWEVYPQFLRRMFTQAFTDGLNNPNKRVGETQWRDCMARLHDSVYLCQNCGAENFYDTEVLSHKSGEGLKVCWSCQTSNELPPRIRIGRKIVMLNSDTLLYPYHIDQFGSGNFSKPIAAVTRSPRDPSKLGLQNLSDEKWVTESPEGRLLDIEPGRSILISNRRKINFGTSVGEIRS